MTFNFWVNETSSWTKHNYNSSISNVNNITSTNTNYRPGLGHYNFSGPPTLPPGPIFIPTVVVSNDSSFYSYGYYYLILLAFLILAGVLAKLAAQRRQQAVRTALSQRLQARQANASSISTISNERMRPNGEAGTNTQPKDTDLPPAYDEVMQTYINAKLQLQAQEEAGAVGGLSSAISSITIETEVDTMASAADLPTTTTIATVASTQPPPIFVSTELKKNSNSIA